MKQLCKDNHYVPQLYLKQWARAGKVPTYRLLVPNNGSALWKDHSTKAIGFHQHLYTYITSQGETDEFELWLGNDFESPAKEAIDRVVNEQQLSPQHWRLLIRFLAAQDVRTPVRFKQFLSRQNRTLPSLIDETLTKAVANLEEVSRLGVQIPKTKKHANDLFPFKVTVIPNTDGTGTVQAKTVVGRQLWLASCRHALTSTLSHLLAHRWTILHAPPGVTWPTSDNPVVRLNFTDLKNYDLLGGWGVKNGEILLPLSPKHLLYTKIGSRSIPRGTVLDEVTARLVRKIIIENADRYVFSQEEGDIHLIRPRKVSLESFRHERLAWQNWHSVQSQAEVDLLR